MKGSGFQFVLQIPRHGKLAVHVQGAVATFALIGMSFVVPSLALGEYLELFEEFAAFHITHYRTNLSDS